MTRRRDADLTDKIRQRDADLADTDHVRSLYVYALLNAAVPAPRLPGHRIEIIKVAGLLVAVERLVEAPGISESTLRAQHQIVVRLGRAANAILPVRFGAFLDEDELERVIRLRRGTLRKALQDVRGKEQMTVRIFGPAKRPESAVAAVSGTEYLLARAASARAPLPPVAGAIGRAVRSLVTSERIDGGRGGIQATLNHLVRRGRAAHYRSLVNAAVAEVELPAAIVVSGPWPPFAFAPDLRKSDRVDAPDRA